MPGGGQWRCFFGNSGTEAIEAAMKLARYATGRYQFIAFQQFVSWTHDGRAFADVVEARSAQRFRPACSRRDAHSVSESVSLSAECDAGDCRRRGACSISKTSCSRRR